jgi:hypothetical protein
MVRKARAARQRLSMPDILGAEYGANVEKKRSFRHALEADNRNGAGWQM